MRTILTVLAGMLLVATVAVMTPTVAQAAKVDCTAGTLCLWYNQNYTSTRPEFTTDDSDLASHSDEAHSVFNTTSVAWVLYDDDTFDDTDRHFCVLSGVSHPDLGGSAYRFGDKISSVRRLASNNCTGFPQITQG